MFRWGRGHPCGWMRWRPWFLRFDSSDAPQVLQNPPASSASVLKLVGRMIHGIPSLRSALQLKTETEPTPGKPGTISVVLATEDSHRLWFLFRNCAYNWGVISIGLELLWVLVSLFYDDDDADADDDMCICLYMVTCGLWRKTVYFHVFSYIHT